MQNCIVSVNSVNNQPADNVISVCIFVFVQNTLDDLLTNLGQEFQQQQHRIMQSFAALREQITAQHQQMLQLVNSTESEARTQLCRLATSAHSQISAVIAAQSQQPPASQTPAPTVSKTLTPPPPPPLIFIPPPTWVQTITQPSPKLEYSTVAKQPVMSASTQQQPKTSAHSEATSIAVKQPFPSTSTQQRHARTTLHSQRVHPYSADTTTTRQRVNPVPATRPRESDDSAPKLPP